MVTAAAHGNRLCACPRVGPQHTREERSEHCLHPCARPRASGGAMQREEAIPDGTTDTKRAPSAAEALSARDQPVQPVRQRGRVLTDELGFPGRWDKGGRGGREGAGESGGGTDLRRAGQHGQVPEGSSTIMPEPQGQREPCSHVLSVALCRLDKIPCAFRV